MSFCHISGGDDFVAGPYEIAFTEGDTPPLTECVEISTIEDQVLEGDHYFSVTIEDIAPEEAVDISGESDFKITITDDDGKKIISF